MSKHPFDILPYFKNCEIAASTVEMNTNILLKLYSEGVIVYLFDIVSVGTVLVLEFQFNLQSWQLGKLRRSVFNLLFHQDLSPAVDNGISHYTTLQCLQSSLQPELLWEGHLCNKLWLSIFISHDYSIIIFIINRILTIWLVSHI